MLQREADTPTSSSLGPTFSYNNNMGGVEMGPPGMSYTQGEADTPLRPSNNTPPHRGGPGMSRQNTGRSLGSRGTHMPPFSGH